MDGNLEGQWFISRAKKNCIQSPFLITQEALKLQQDVRKKKQEILEKHIETQKVRCRRNKGFCCSVLICIDLDDLSKIIMFLKKFIFTSSV